MSILTKLIIKSRLWIQQSHDINSKFAIAGWFWESSDICILTINLDWMNCKQCLTPFVIGVCVIDLEMVNSDRLQNHRLCTRTNLLFEAWLWFITVTLNIHPKDYVLFFTLFFWGTNWRSIQRIQLEFNRVHGSLKKEEDQSKTGKERETAEAILHSSTLWWTQ